MREIKFRAYEKDSFDETGKMICAEDFMKNWNLGFLFLNPSTNPCNRLKIMQYTGLKDKNGKEIYEGDVYNMGDENILYVVEWHDCSLLGKQIGSSSWAGLSYWNEKIEVIGNIYENPELLIKKH